MLENENLIDYETERRFITSPYNKLSFYIPGKGITVDEDGCIRFYPMTDIDEFIFGQDIEPELLFDDFQLTPEEKNAIRELQKYNVQLNEKDISVVYMRLEKKQLFLFITTENRPEVFYKISEADIDKVVKDKLSETQPNTISSAKYIKF
ncbi:MAG: hypothetical protein HFJ98_06725 [Eubacterium sp.]|nr:hypothetical protein [Eubacterium sp.]